MFREIVRKKQQIPTAECIEILRTQLRGVLSVNGDDGYAYGMPMNYWYCEADGKIYFHGGKHGHKIDAVRRDSKASFCVMDEGIRENGDWALNFRSVIVFGRIELIEDDHRVVEISRALCTKFTDDASYIEHEVEQFGKATLCFALVPEHITGKRVNEK